MLVLSRKNSESIIVNDNVVITVIEILGNRVRLGIEAPHDVSVHRKEVWVAIQEKEALEEKTPPKPEFGAGIL